MPRAPTQPRKRRKRKITPGQPARPIYLCLWCRQSGHKLLDCPLFLASKESVNPADQRPCTQSPSTTKIAGQEIVRDGFLCNRCQKLDILRLFQPHKGEWLPEEHSLGRADSIVLREDCSLCRLLFTVAPWVRESTHEWMLVRGSCKDRLARDAFDYGTDVAACLYICSRTQYGKPYLFLISRWCYEAENIIILLGNHDAPESPLRQWNPMGHSSFVADPQGGGLGRKMATADINISLISEWLQGCDRAHGSICGREQSTDLRSIRLIDVMGRTVVPYPSHGKCDYLALSYVWGNVNQRNYAIGSRIEGLPSTIEDAITVTRRIGKRHLWVDSICIEQNKAAHKINQIMLMSAIYRGAWATIVAVSGESANAGLARINSNILVHPQAVCSISGRRLASGMPTLEQALAGSPWISRAWTLQEALLSPRCLYFTEHQTYFECNVTQCMETLGNLCLPLRPTFSGDIRPLGEGLFRNPFINDLGGSIADAENRMSQGFFCYETFLRAYTYRNMTDDSDSINAFLAILQQLEGMYFRSGFFWGLPIDALPRALLWNYAPHPRRRSMFPSWSWAGWHGRLLAAFLKDHLLGQIEICVRAWGVSQGVLVAFNRHVDNDVSHNLCICNRHRQTLLRSLDTDGLPVTCLCHTSPDPGIPPRNAETAGYLLIDGAILRVKFKKFMDLNHSLGLPPSSDFYKIEVEGGSEPCGFYSHVCVYLSRREIEARIGCHQELVLVAMTQFSIHFVCHCLLLHRISNKTHSYQVPLYERVAAMDLSIKATDMPEFWLNHAKRQWILLG